MHPQIYLHVSKHFQIVERPTAGSAHLHYRTCLAHSVAETQISLISLCRSLHREAPPAIIDRRMKPGGPSRSVTLFRRMQGRPSVTALIKHFSPLPPGQQPTKAQAGPRTGPKHPRPAKPTSVTWLAWHLVVDHVPVRGTGHLTACAISVVGNYRPLPAASLFIPHSIFLNTTGCRRASASTKRSSLPLPCLARPAPGRER
ncbi:hypothetical protein F4777DRAFT_195118 [Nemania sp. FL0916]|nr:hypothetical protein F4777DRAFT_195118 [Nemania sp. FL0916]